MDFLTYLTHNHDPKTPIWIEACHQKTYTVADLIHTVNHYSKDMDCIPKNHVIAVDTHQNTWESFCSILAIIHAERVAFPISKPNRQELVNYGVAGLYTPPKNSPSTIIQFSEPSMPDPKTRLILKTSGSSGKTCLVMLGQDGIMHNVHGILSYLPIKNGTRVGFLTPLHYSYGLIGQCMTAIKAGSTIVSLTKGPWIARQVEEMEHYNVQVLSAVPSLLKSIVQIADQKRLPDLYVLANAGAPLSKKLIRQIVDRFPKIDIINQYGMTEASPRICAGTISVQSFTAGLVGTPLPNISIHTQKKASAKNPQPLYVRTPSAMIGYWNDPHHTKKVLTSEGLYTGDLGWIDDAGNVYICSREDDLINIGAERISLHAVHNSIVDIPQVDACVILTTPDAYLDAAIVAFVIAPSIDQKQLRKKIRTLFPTVARPQNIYFVSDFPYNSNGKIDKKRLLHMATKE